MKTNGKTIIIAAIAIIVASLMLSASVVALANEAPEDEAFAPSESAAVEIPAQVEAPKPVADFIQEQSDIKTETADRIVLYEGDLFEAALLARGNGIDEEELALIINDTMQMYNQYAEIVLTNAYELPGFAYLYDPDYIAANTHLSSPAERVGNDAVIRSLGANGVYFRDEAEGKDFYEDLMCIIEYRIEMADSRLTTGYDKDEYLVNGVDWIHTIRAGEPGEDRYEKKWYVRYERVCLLAQGENDVHPELSYTVSFDYETGDDTIVNSYDGAEPMIIVSFDDVMITGGDSLLGYKHLNVGRSAGNAHYGSHDLSIHEYKLDRNFMTDQVKCLVPGYDTDTRTALLSSEEYVFETGMSFAELINEYGVPYTTCSRKEQGKITPAGMSIAPEILCVEGSSTAFDEFKYYAGYYVTTDGKLFTVYFSHDGEFTVTGFDCVELF